MNPEIEEDILCSIQPTQEDFINRRINHRPFALTVFWLDITSKKQDFIYASDLSDYQKISNSRAYLILRELCKVGILFRKQVGNLVEFHFCKNDGYTIISKYIQRAKKTLDLP